MNVQAGINRVDEQPRAITVFSATYAKICDIIGAQVGEFVSVYGTEHTMIVDEGGEATGKRLTAAASMRANLSVRGDAIILRYDDIDAIPFH